jgi:hypothetical protein
MALLVLPLPSICTPPPFLSPPRAPHPLLPTSSSECNSASRHFPFVLSISLRNPSKLTLFIESLLFSLIVMPIMDSIFLFIRSPLTDISFGSSQQLVGVNALSSYDGESGLCRRTWERSARVQENNRDDRGTIFSKTSVDWIRYGPLILTRGGGHTAGRTKSGVVYAIFRPPFDLGTESIVRATFTSHSPSTRLL